MKRAIDPDVSLLEAIADPARLAILRQLAADGATCACDLVGCCGVGQSTVSHHLKVLRQAGWVEAERRGTWIWYSLRPGAVARLGRIAGSLEGRTTASGRTEPNAGPAASIVAPVHGRRALPVLDADWRQW